MVWTERNTVSLREEFVHLACQAGANRRALCRRFGISPKTGYKWLARALESPGDDGQSVLRDRSRRPNASPARSTAAVEQAVVDVRREHPAWGGRKIARRLLDLGHAALAPSTVTHILHRHGLITPDASQAAAPWQRFEHDAPNGLWQIDFKGRFATLAGPCHALTLLDDHSRFNLLLRAQPRTDTAQVQPQLVEVFQRYGLPARINADNGSPWGSPSAGGRSLSELAVWLIRLGVRVSFSAPYHPQTNGKLERFHRTLDVEVIAGRHFPDLAATQRAFDAWRTIYNCQRPHEALALQVPIQRYQASPIAYPQRLPAIEYPRTDTVITVGWNGFIHFHGRKLRTSTALHRLPIGIRANPELDGVHHVYFCHQKFMTIDLRADKPDT
ncbi:IS481 family transposase [Ideonella sp. DXS22W]|uniref:IS481 family transposase n=1 Tax=Pseudaquabacterium inlustre TaxID=2984192 RepID=A0ABU9CR12_9BURK